MKTIFFSKKRGLLLSAVMGAVSLVIALLWDLNGNMIQRFGALYFFCALTVPFILIYYLEGCIVRDYPEKKDMVYDSPGRLGKIRFFMFVQLVEPLFEPEDPYLIQLKREIHLYYLFQVLWMVFSVAAVFGGDWLL